MVFFGAPPFSFRGLFLGPNRADPFDGFLSAAALFRSSGSLVFSASKMQVDFGALFPGFLPVSAL
jgi:hypothetical protein